MKKTVLVLSLLFATSGFSQIHNQKNLSGICRYQATAYSSPDFAFINLHRVRSTVFFFEQFSDASLAIVYGWQYQGIGLDIQLNRSIPELGHTVNIDSLFISEPNSGQKIYFYKRDALGQFIQYSCELEIEDETAKTESLNLRNDIELMGSFETLNIKVEDSSQEICGLSLIPSPFNSPEDQQTHLKNYFNVYLENGKRLQVKKGSSGMEVELPNSLPRHVKHVHIDAQLVTEFSEIKDLIGAYDHRYTQSIKVKALPCP